MSPIRTRRARAARGGRENRLVPETAATTPAKSAFEFKKYPQTPRSARTAAPRKVAHRRSTIFVIEQAGKQQRHILADRRVQVNVAQDLVQRRKTIEPVHKPDDSPDSPETDVLDSEEDEDGDGDEERHVHWTDGIKNKAGSVVLPPLVPPMHFPLLRNKARISYPRSILQVSVYRDPLVTPRKPASATSSHLRGRTTPPSTPVFDFTTPGVTLRTQEQSRPRSQSASRSHPIVDADRTPTGLVEQHPFADDDTPRGCTTTVQTLRLQMRRSLSAQSGDASQDPSGSGVSQATMTEDAPRVRQLSPTPASDNPALFGVTNGVASPYQTVQGAIEEDSSDRDTLDSDSPPRIRPSLFRLPHNRIDRFIIFFSMFYFPIAIYMLLPVFGLV
ncbi:hypothetical protein OH76DRAFT_608718 [Lentinus brumalis]|uniref:Uncharacterized protein n=1 Tax=Lentinus brumalis TaxID=2498619 RepID=A0A371DUS4_9APHY|nr:hypothetical protein OH76DRAFT_608718 [Polyporus brumalis]